VIAAARRFAGFESPSCVETDAQSLTGIADSEAVGEVGWLAKPVSAIAGSGQAAASGIPTKTAKDLRIVSPFDRFDC